MWSAADLERIHPLVSSHVAEDVLRAAVMLGGEAQRVELIDSALRLGGWSPQELEVPARWKRAARPTHLRAIVDLAVDLCGRRGLLEPAGTPGRWRLPAQLSGPGVGSEYRPARRSALREQGDAQVTVDLDELERRTEQHMRLQERMVDLLRARGFEARSWRAPEPVYDLAFLRGEQLVVVEVKTLLDGAESDQLRRGTGQLLEYRHRLARLHDMDVVGMLLTSAPAPHPWPELLLDAGLEALDDRGLEEQLDAMAARRGGRT